MNKLFLNLFLLCLLVPFASAQFLSENPEYRNMARENHVDVYYEYAGLPGGNTAIASGENKFGKGNWNIAESARKRLICESGRLTLFILPLSRLISNTASIL